MFTVYPVYFIVFDQRTEWYSFHPDLIVLEILLLMF